MPHSASTINFFNPIYGNSRACSNEPDNERMGWLGRIVEPYFDFGQETYEILPSGVQEKIVPIEAKSLRTTITRIIGFVLKFISYLTGVCPLLMLAGKLIYRANNQFTIQEGLTKCCLEKNLNKARKILNKFEAKIDAIPTEELKGINTSYLMIQDIEESSKDFSKILSKSYTYLTNDDHETFDRAIELSEQLTAKLTTKISSYNEMINRFCLSWQAAAKNNINTTQRMELYAKTEKIVNFLNKAVKKGDITIMRDVHNLCDALDDGFKNSLKSNLLPEWIERNTSRHAMRGKIEYNGAYKSFHQLYNAASNVKEARSLSIIDKVSLRCFEQNKDPCLPLDWEIVSQTYSQLSINDLLRIRDTSIASRTLGNIILIDLLKNKKIKLGELGIQTIAEAKAFFGEHCSKILSFKPHKNDKDIEEIPKLFPNLTQLSLGVQISDKLISALVEMPSLTSLNFSGNGLLRNFSFLKNCKSLKEVNFQIDPCDDELLQSLSAKKIIVGCEMYNELAQSLRDNGIKVHYGIVQALLDKRIWVIRRDMEQPQYNDFLEVLHAFGETFIAFASH